jgi:hypothetical protein
MYRIKQGLNSPIKPENAIQSMLTKFLVFDNVKANIINKHLPVHETLTAKFNFMMLVRVSCYPMLTKTGYSDKFGVFRRSSKLSLDYLISIGLVAERGSPRLIIPFQKTKIDKVCVVTEKGEKVIKDVLREIGLI